MNIKPLPDGSLVPPWQNEAVSDNIKGKCKNKRFLLISYWVFAYIYIVFPFSVIFDNSWS